MVGGLVGYPAKRTLTLTLILILTLTLTLTLSRSWTATTRLARVMMMARTIVRRPRTPSLSVTSSSRPFKVSHSQDH